MSDPIERLYAAVMARKGAPAGSSRTAKLFSTGTPKIAQKLGEEAVETVIEAMAGDKEKLAEESADLLYHLLVLWADAGLKPEDVYAVLAAREGVGGIAEKASRKKGK